MLSLLQLEDLTRLEQMRYQLEATIPQLQQMQVAGAAHLPGLLLQVVLGCTLLLSQLPGEENESVEAYLDEITDQR